MVQGMVFDDLELFFRQSSHRDMETGVLELEVDVQFS